MLFHYPWLRHKLAHTDINALAIDYALLPDYPEAATVAATLTLSAHVLTREPDQLGPQLVSRLSATDGRLLCDYWTSSDILAPCFLWEREAVDGARGWRSAPFTRVLSATVPPRRLVCVP
jgi:hypothetical protein